MSKWREKTQPFMLLLVLFLSFLFLYPFWEVLVVSFSKPAFSNLPGFKFFPPEFTLDSYKEVLQTNNIPLAFWNNIFRTVVTTALHLIVTYAAGYALAHKELPLRNLITLFFVFTMFFGGGMIPSYLNMRELGLKDTLWATIIPAICGAYNILIIRNFVMSIGREIEESAEIDGANPIQTMIMIMVPLSGAVLAVVGLWVAVGKWNSWYDAMLYANGDKDIVLPLLIRRITASNSTEDALSMMTVSKADMTSGSVRNATIIVCTAPILIVYPFLQRYFVKGIMVGSLKG